MPNFLRINFYFDKEVMEYLGVAKQEKSNKKTEQEKSNRKKNKINAILEFCEVPKSGREIMEYIDNCI